MPKKTGKRTTRDGDRRRLAATLRLELEILSEQAAYSVRCGRTAMRVLDDLEAGREPSSGDLGLVMAHPEFWIAKRRAEDSGDIEVKTRRGIRTCR